MSLTVPKIILVVPIRNASEFREGHIKGRGWHTVIVDYGCSAEQHEILLSKIQEALPFVSIVRVDQNQDYQFASLRGIAFAINTFPKSEFVVELSPGFDELELLLHKSFRSDVVVAHPPASRSALSVRLFALAVGVNAVALNGAAYCYNTRKLKLISIDIHSESPYAEKLLILLELAMINCSFDIIPCSAAALPEHRVTVQEIRKLACAASRVILGVDRHKRKR